MSEAESRLTRLETKVDMFIDEMRDFKTEIRDRDNQRVAEIAELRQKHDADMKAMAEKHDSDMKAMAEKHDADVRTINQKIDTSIAALRQTVDSTNKHMQALIIAAVVGVIAVVIGVLISIWSDHKQNVPQPSTQNQSVNFAGKKLYAAKFQVKECDRNVS